MIVASFVALPILLLVFVQRTVPPREEHHVLATAMSVLPGLVGIIYGFFKLRPHAEISRPSQSDVFKMHTDSLMTMALGEMGVLCSIFVGGRLLVECVIAIALFALSVAVNVLPTGLTVFSNFEKNKSE